MRATLLNADETVVHEIASVDTSSECSETGHPLVGSMRTPTGRQVIVPASPCQPPTGPMPGSSVRVRLAKGPSQIAMDKGSL